MPLPHFKVPNSKACDVIQLRDETGKMTGPFSVSLCPNHFMQGTCMLSPLPPIRSTKLPSTKTFYKSGTILGAGDLAMNKRDKFFCPGGVVHRNVSATPF